MLVVVGRSEELLKSEFVRAWVNHVLGADISALEMKNSLDADRVRDDDGIY